jgi:hypothetical protein
MAAIALVGDDAPDLVADDGLVGGDKTRVDALLGRAMDEGRLERSIPR